jgi:hypothetical protein
MVSGGIGIYIYIYITKPENPVQCSAVLVGYKTAEDKEKKSKKLKMSPFLAAAYMAALKATTTRDMKGHLSSLMFLYYCWKLRWPVHLLDEGVSSREDASSSCPSS